MSAAMLVRGFGVFFAVMSGASVVIATLFGPTDERGTAFAVGVWMAGGSAWLAWALLYQVQP